MGQSLGHTLSAAPQATSAVQMFYIGRNSRGQWVVQDQRHTCGGLFADRAEAVRYAMFENGRQRHAVIMVPDGLELDLGGTSAASAKV